MIPLHTSCWCPQATARHCCQVECATQTRPSVRPTRSLSWAWSLSSLHLCQIQLNSQRCGYLLLTCVTYSCDTWTLDDVGVRLYDWWTLGYAAGALPRVKASHMHTHSSIWYSCLCDVFTCIPHSHVLNWDLSNMVLVAQCPGVVSPSSHLYHHIHFNCVDFICSKQFAWAWATGCFFTLGLPLKVPSTEKLIYAT